jgi:hypothetical protein
LCPASFFGDARSRAPATMTTPALPSARTARATVDTRMSDVSANPLLASAHTAVDRCKAEAFLMYRMMRGTPPAPLAGRLREYA